MSTDIPGSWDWQKKAKIDQACLQSFCCCPAPFALRMHPGFNDFAIPSALIETPRESDADGAASLPMIFERRCRVMRALGVPRRSPLVGLPRRRRAKLQARTRRSGGQGVSGTWIFYGWMPVPPFSLGLGRGRGRAA